MSGLVTHFFSLNLNPLQGLCPSSKSTLPQHDGPAGAEGCGWCCWGGDHLLGSSMQDPSGVKPGLYRQLWAGTWLGSSGGAGDECICVFRDLPGTGLPWRAPVCCPRVSLWATAGMCCSNLGSDCVESWCLFQFGLLYLALTEVYMLLLLFSSEVIFILLCSHTSKAWQFQTQLPALGVVLAFNGYLFQLGCYSLYCLLDYT